MFKSISWNAYLYTVGIITAAYYLLVIFLFYRSDVAAIARRLFNSGLPKRVKEFEIDSMPIQNLQQKLDDLKEVLSAFGKDGDPSELLSVLRSSLSDYEYSHSPAHRDAIVLFISAQANRLCSLELSEPEIEQCFTTNLR